MEESRTGMGETRYDVTLVSTGHRPQRVARIIAEFTDRTTREAMGMMETVPVPMLQGASYAAAEGARMALERLGATVVVRANEVETAGRPPQSSTPLTSRLTVWTIVGWGFVILFLLFFVFVLVASLIVANLGDPTF